MPKRRRPENTIGRYWGSFTEPAYGGKRPPLNWMMSKRVKTKTRRKIAEGRLAEKNWMWRGDNVGYGSLHEWVKKRMPKPLLCEHCHIKPPLDLTNISGKYKRELDDWEWLCRRCHMEIDGRLSKFKQFRRKANAYLPEVR